MRILINDANILIDLAGLGIVEIFCLLEYELCTTDFILEEIAADQRIAIDEEINRGRFSVITTEQPEDFNAISELTQQNQALSFEDCSAWYYCQKRGGILVTGDGRLRRSAENDGIEVRGIIFLFDRMLIQDLISFDEAIRCLTRLQRMNHRLPADIIDQRLQAWRREKHFDKK